MCDKTSETIEHINAGRCYIKQNKFTENIIHQTLDLKYKLFDKNEPLLQI